MTNTDGCEACYVIEMAAARPLLDVLAELFPDSSKTTLRKMLQNDRVLVNGRPERDAKRSVAATDEVEIGSRRRERLDPRVEIVYEDQDLVVIDKAAELLAVESPAERHETATALLNAHYNGRRVHVVHRLDRDTSGVMVFARNGDMRDLLKALFATHDLTRIYAAVVHGTLEPSRGTIRSFLAEDRSLRVRSIADVDAGKEAITRYETVAGNGRFSLLDVTLETGRRNQIRVHMAEAGHPLVGDTMYGGGRADPLGRLALHARHLGFMHPRTGRRVEFEVPAPPEFAELVR